jgi:hypothetical protein
MFGGNTGTEKLIIRDVDFTNLTSVDRTLGINLNNGSRTLLLAGDLSVTSSGGASVDGTNTGDVTLAGQSYLSRTNQVITANAVDLSGTHVTGILAAARLSCSDRRRHNAVRFRGDNDRCEQGPRYDDPPVRGLVLDRTLG